MLAKFNKAIKSNLVFRIIIILAVLALSISCDQISKKIVRHQMHYFESISLLNNHLTLTKVENTGAFLSMGNALPQSLKLIFMMIIPFILLCFAFIFLLTRRQLTNLKIFGICLIIGGGVGNIYDRIVYGSVTDFLHIDFVLFKTGIFNMADVSIMVGMAFLLLDYYFQYKQNKLLNT